MHTPFDRDTGTVEQNTRMYCRVLENPYVTILGHTGRSGHPYELRPVLETAKRLHLSLIHIFLLADDFLIMEDPEP